MKQSVYLSESEHARWKALGASLGEVVRAGLAEMESRHTLTAAATEIPEAAPAGAGTITATARRTCRTCGEPVRPLRPEDGLDPRDFDWTHEDGNPICDGPPTAMP
jgi:hypothetical protein